MYIVALSVHEIEELKLPGGFVELVTGITGGGDKESRPRKIRAFSLYTMGDYSSSTAFPADPVIRAAGGDSEIEWTEIQ